MAKQLPYVGGTGLTKKGLPQVFDTDVLPQVFWYMVQIHSPSCTGTGVLTDTDVLR